MKKLILVLFVFVLMVGIVSAQELPLKEVIQKSARGLEETIPQGTAIAILSFKSPTVKFSEYVIEALTDELLETGKLAVVDRSNINAIREEQVLSLSGDVSDESAVAIGKMLGAHYIITGLLTDTQFRIRIVNVETATIQRQITSELHIDSQVASLLDLQRPAVRDNWISGEISGGFDDFVGPTISIGIRYERMLNANISVGANINLGIPLPMWDSEEEKEFAHYNIDRDIAFGIDVFFRYYPWGGNFFCGLGLGYYHSANYIYSYNPVPPLDVYAIVSQVDGFAITGELGWKIDVGAEGGFYVQPGFLATFIAGSRYDKTYGVYNGKHDDGNGLGVNYRVYIGAGWAF